MEEIINEFRKMLDRAYPIYSKLAARISDGQITEADEIERVMDYIIGYCYDDRFLELYKSICRRAAAEHPQMVAEHIMMYKKLYEEEEHTEHDRT